VTSHHVEVLKRVDLFAGVDDATIERLFALGELSVVKKGSFVVRQGEFGDSCFVLLDGDALVQVVGDDGRQKNVARLGPGRVFGELALIGRGERKASVLSYSDCEVLQLRRIHFDQALKKHKAVRARLEETYQKAAIDTFVRQSRYFRDLPDDSLERIVSSSTLKTFSKGDVIAAEGQSAQELFIVRTGFVRISRKVEEAGASEEILAYLGPEDFFGDEEVTVGADYGASAVALEPVECVSVPRSTVWKLYLGHPEVFSSVRRYSLARSQAQSSILRSQTSMGFVRDMLEAGLGQARSALIINLDVCVRCGNCVQACDDLHGYSRIARRGKKMTRRTDLEKSTHEDIYFPTSCLQCATPECMVGCPTGAIARDVGGEVYIKDTCIGCGSCARNCDFGNISMAEVKSMQPSLLDMVMGTNKADGKTHEAKDRAPTNPGKKAPAEKGAKKTDLIAVKCDVCFEREFAACVYNCPVEAVLRVDPRSYFQELQQIAPRAHSAQEAPRAAKTTGVRRRGRVGNLLLQLVALAAGLGGAVYLHGTLSPTPWSGLGMYAGIAAAVMLVLLAAMGVRKRLRTQRLGSLASWARVHAVVGGLVYGVILFHSGFQATSVLTATLLALITLSVAVGLVGQLASVLLPKILARTESEALLPEDVGPKVAKLLDAADEFLADLDEKRRVRVRGQAERLTRGGWHYVRRGLDPKALVEVLEQRAKRLPALSENDHAIAVRVAANLAEARMHAVRRGLEILLTGWVPLHLVTSAMAMMLLLGHLMTVVLW
jgi:CRP-like cAMP-binding protein/Fe-S-cluster-containing hydrogenase component 2